MGCYLGKLWRLHRSYHSAIFCDGRMYDLFEEVCEKLGIPAGKVELVEDAHDVIPKIIGIVHPTVVIPLQEYTEDELRMIYIHELTHYRQKLVWFKHLTEIAGAIHFFNPCMWILVRKVEYWGEHVCDYESIAAVDNMKAYFTVIAAMQLNSQKGGKTHVSDDAKGRRSG
jgi:beta-lactamase regulating signal transducer with metallopeptidase domain